MFKKGDVVKRTGKDFFEVRTGHIYVVAKALPTQIEVGGRGGRYLSSEFKLLYSPPPVPADTEQSVAIAHMASALTTQVGGDHYKDMAIQPVEYIIKNNIPFVEGNVIKYVSRWRKKNGVQDLEKAKHLLDVLIQNEKAKV